MSIRRTTIAALAAAGLLTFALAGSATVSGLPSGFIDTLGASGLTNPTAMAFAPGGNRIFVAEQGGALRVIKNGQLLPTPFVSLTVDDNGERGLLGVAFDPQFSSNQYVYVYYTVPGAPANNRVSRFTAQGDRAVTGSEFILLDIQPLSGATNHNGGAIHFGNDGKLYIAVGDNANRADAQVLTNLKGKLLRINKDGTIPTDNPFYGVATGINQAIWALGLRNPFTFAVQRSTGRILINDVGESSYEEINDGIAGANYGWPNCEGPCNPPDPRFRNPVKYYAHTGNPTPNGCAIIGGAFYNPPTPTFPPMWVGKYFFTDLCSGWIKRADPANNFALNGFGTGISSPVQIELGTDASLYYLERGTGSVRRISYLNTPTISRLRPGSGRVGTTVQVNGTSLAGASSVKFNGTPATFTIAADTMLLTKVPPGATSGPVTVTTPRATATSPTSFTVTP